ncbi:hypothetical protein EJB05_55876, partial [Eragrostis curvula]
MAAAKWALLLLLALPLLAPAALGAGNGNGNGNGNNGNGNGNGNGGNGNGNNGNGNGNNGNGNGNGGNGNGNNGNGTGNGNNGNGNGNNGNGNGKTPPPPAGDLPEEVQAVVPHELRHLQTHCNVPGAVCEDPRFIGGDGNTFYFHGLMNRDFCLLSDANLHINAHFIGSHVPGLKRDPTWVQAIAVQFSGHRLYVGARKTAVWDDESDRLAIFFDGELVELPGAANARWEAPSASALSVTRTKAANGVVVELAGVFKIRANAVPITKEDSRTHNYGLTAGDCLAHLDLAFKFYSLTDDVHGVLGQTYRSSYVNRLDVSAKMPVMGGEREFAASGLFATDCSVARYEHGSVANVLASEEVAGVKCSTSHSGAGVVCKK